MRAYNNRVLVDGEPDLIARFDWIRFRRPRRVDAPASEP
ncbi:hypothetical protein NAEX_00742 [Nannocystis exedens]|nr:hypothetical protein NAEX_00742 [Nannocystis exedens]